MAKLAQRFPGYGWEKNTGNLTKEHIEGIKSLGVTSLHRDLSHIKALQDAKLKARVR